jgi:radical SAM superfamily enzyme YgiQ (UPF0313 family)
MDTGILSDREITAFLERPYDLIGFSVSSRAYWESVDLLRRYKYLHPDTPVVYGGPHVSMMKEQALEREPMIDYAVVGEGEVTFYELVSVIKEQGINPRPDDLQRIDGLIWRHDDEIVVNRSREQIQDLDALPLPAFDLFPVKRYPSEYPITTSRGCPFSCTFCTVASLWGNRRFRVHSAKKIVDEIECRVDTYGPRPVVIHDDAFNVQLKRLIDICNEIIERKVRIPFSVRGFRIDILNENTAKLLRKAGCTSVGIGVECANNEMLKRMKKGTTVEVMDKGITMLRRAGIHVRGQFMIGNPGETQATVKDSIEFARKSDLTSSTFSMAVPFPSTLLWKYASESGHFLVDKDVTTFDNVLGKVIFETPEFTRDERIQAREMARKAGFFYSRVEKKSVKRWLKDVVKAIWFRHLYPRLPRWLSWRVYLFLRKVLKGSEIAHDASEWARTRGITYADIRMKAGKDTSTTAARSRIS